METKNTVTETSAASAALAASTKPGTDVLRPASTNLPPALCWQCSQLAPYECVASTCDHRVCSAHSTPATQARDRSQGALCKDHSTLQQPLPVDSPGTVWLQPPNPQEPPVEVEYFPHEVSKLMVQGYRQVAVVDPPEIGAGE